MISKVQAYNVNQPNFTSKVHISDNFKYELRAKRLTDSRYIPHDELISAFEKLLSNLNKQIKKLRRNGNNDSIIITSDGDRMQMTVVNHSDKSVRISPNTYLCSNKLNFENIYNELLKQPAENEINFIGFK